MKKWINLNLIKNLSSRTLTVASILMMVMAPVADGFAAEKVMKDLNEARVKEILVQIGMTKPQTLGEFYKKNKNQMPKRLQNLIGTAVDKNKNVQIPQIEITSSKTTDGITIPVVRMVFGGELFNVEIHDNDKYFAKVGNTEFTRVEINNFTTMFEKLYHNDPRFRRLVDNNPNGAVKSVFPVGGNVVKNEFGYPEMTKEIWKSLTPEGRVQYILNLRQLWTSAMSVLINKKDSSIHKMQDGKKSSSMDLLEKIWKELSPDAQAAGDVAAKKNAVTKERRETGAPGGTAKTVVNSSCLVAGYITEYRGSVCGLDAIKARYITNAKNDTVKKAQAICGDKKIACNPLIYGFPEEGGEPKCVPISYEKGAPFQIATNYNGPCDKASPLSETQVQMLVNDKLIGKDRYADENLVYKDPEKLKEEIRKEQSKNNYNLTKDFLAGVIRSKDKDMAALFEKGEITDEMLIIIKETKTEFNYQITEARKACTSSANTGRKQESNFLGACDQMHRRELFVADFLKTQIKCIDGGELDNETYKCSCPEAKFPKGTVSLPGQKCTGGTPGGAAEGGPQCIPVVGNPAKCAEDNSPEAKCKAVGMIVVPGSKPEEIVCACASNPKLTSGLADIPSKFDPKQCQSGGTGTPAARVIPTAPADDGGSCAVALQQECIDGKDGKKGEWLPITSGASKACKCEKKGDDEESWWTRNKTNVIKYGILGVALWLLLRSAPKKPSLNPAGDTCTNGATACPTACPKANQTAVNGVCQCRVPSPLEVLVDSVQCTYQVNTGTTTTLTCPNGTTKVTSLTDCPKKACSDGSTVYDGQNCPVATPTAKPTATGVDVKK